MHLDLRLSLGNFPTWLPSRTIESSDTTRESKDSPDAPVTYVLNTFLNGKSYLLQAHNQVSGLCLIPASTMPFHTLPHKVRGKQRLCDRCSSHLGVRKALLPPV